MSNPGGSAEQSELEAFRQLEEVAGKALRRLEVYRGRIETAERRGAEMEELVRRFTGDEAEAGRMLSRLEALETENTDLRARLEQGREGVQRLLARIRFLEEQR